MPDGSRTDAEVAHPGAGPECDVSRGRGVEEGASVGAAAGLPAQLATVGPSARTPASASRETRAARAGGETDDERTGSSSPPAL